MQSTTRAKLEKHYGKQSLPKRLYNRLRGSFLLQFAVLGALILLLGIPAMMLEEPIWAGVLGASGIVILIINLVFYLGYKFLEARI